MTAAETQIAIALARNSYRYVDGEPSTKTDPLGLWDISRPPFTSLNPKAPASFRPAPNPPKLSCYWSCAARETLTGDAGEDAFFFTLRATGEGLRASDNLASMIFAEVLGDVTKVARGSFVGWNIYATNEKCIEECLCRLAGGNAWATFP